MAAQNETKEVPAKKSKMPLIIAGVILLGGLAGGGWYYTTQQSHQPKAEKVEPAKAPVFVVLDTFTINLVPDPGEQFLQVDITLQLNADASAETIKTHMPEVRNRLLMLLTTKKGSEISTLEGKKSLSAEISAALNQPFATGEKGDKVTGVFFTSFVIQ